MWYLIIGLEIVFFMISFYSSNKVSFARVPFVNLLLCFLITNIFMALVIGAFLLISYGMKVFGLGFLRKFF